MKRKISEKLGNTRSQKVLAIAIFVIFFVGLAVLFARQLPDISTDDDTKYTSEIQADSTMKPYEILQNDANNLNNSNAESFADFTSEKITNLENLCLDFISLVDKMYSRVEKNQSDVYKTEDNNLLVRDSNGKLHKIFHRIDPYEAINNVKKLAQYASKNHAKVFYINVPYDISEHSKLPRGIYDGSKGVAKICNRKIQSLSRNEKHNIVKIDLNKPLSKPLNENTLRDNLTFDNDYLWKPMTAWYAAAETVRAASAQFDFGKYMDFSDIYNYTIKTKKEFYRGTFSRIIGVDLVSASDFDIITPKITTKFKVTAKGNKITTGDFEEAVMDRENLKSNTDCYNGYLRGGDDWTEIENLYTSSKTKALIIGDDFAIPYAAFMSPYCKELTFVNMTNHDKSPKADIYELINKKGFDAIYILASPSALGTKSFWSFK